jgi:methylmalonyl-CoA mutase, N-terminal domain
MVKVGVNEFVDPDEPPIETLIIPPETETSQVEAVKRMRAGRDDEAASRALAALSSAAATEGENLMPPLVDCARAYCTEGEIVGALRDVFGEYTETPRF